MCYKTNSFQKKYLKKQIKFAVIVMLTKEQQYYLLNVYQSAI